MSAAGAAGWGAQPARRMGDTRGRGAAAWPCGSPSSSSSRGTRRLARTHGGESRRWARSPHADREVVRGGRGRGGVRKRKELPGVASPWGAGAGWGDVPPWRGGNARAWGRVAVTSARPGAFPNTNFHPLPASCWCWGGRIGQGTALGCVGVKGDSTGGTPRGCSGLPFPVLGEDRGGCGRAGTAPSLPVPSEAAVGVTSADNHLQPAPLYAGTWLNKGSG